MAADEISAFLTHLAVNRNVSASTQNQALNAIVFLYKQVLNLNPGIFENVVRAKRPIRLPVVLTQLEVKRLLDSLTGSYKLMGALLYGTGMRVMELLRLRVKDIDLEKKLITIREGKGDKDRITMLPNSLVESFKTHLARVKILHDQDLQHGFGAVHLPDALAVKYPNMNKSCKIFTRAKWVLKLSTRELGSIVILSLSPFPSRMVINFFSRSISLTRRRSSSITRMPVP
jgi:integrase